MPVVVPLIGLVLAFAAMSVSVSANEPQPPRYVLTLHAGAEDSPANPALDAGIREALSTYPYGPVAYFTEYLESDRFGPGVAAEALAEYIRRKYKGTRIDLVIAVTNRSLQFAIGYRDTLFPGAPVVFAGFDVPNHVARRGGAGIAAVRMAMPSAETLKLALHLHPSTERVFVVAASPNAVAVDYARFSLAEVAARTKITYIEEQNLADLIAAVRRVPPRSLILYLFHRNVPAGDELHAQHVARLVAQAASVPIYGVSDEDVGSGFVGGVTRRVRATGVRVGELARDILSGARPQDMPVQTAQAVPTFDWRQVQRWGIDPSRLPANADIRFKTPSVWDAYRPHITAIVAVIAVQLALITGLLTQHARRRRAERTIVAREITLRNSFDRIRQLAGRLLDAQEAARAEIARDLHDDVCQELVGVSIAVSSLKRSAGNIQDPQTQEALADLEHLTLDVLEGVRRLSHELHPASLRLLGLATALRAHCIEVEKRYDVQVSFKTDDDLRNLRPDVAVCLFRIAQEALRNGAVNGQARRLAVSITRAGEHLELMIIDDGRGFDLEAVHRSNGGLGLVSMEERARLVGGNVQVVTGLREGTAVRVRVPAIGRSEVEDDRGGVTHRVPAPLSALIATERV